MIDAYGFRKPTIPKCPSPNCSPSPLHRVGEVIQPPTPTMEVLGWMIMGLQGLMIVALGWIGGNMVTSPSLAQLPPQPVVSLATSPARQQQKREQAQLLTPEYFNLQAYPVSDRTETHWRKLLWATAIIEPQDEFVGMTIRSILQLAQRPTLSMAQRRIVHMALQVGTQLYLSQSSGSHAFKAVFETILETNTNEQWVAMAVSALARTPDLGSQVGFTYPPQSHPDVGKWLERIKVRFPHWRNNNSLYTTLVDIGQPKPSLPPLNDLFTWSIAPNQFHLYVLCRPNRFILCQAILKDPQGSWVREGDRLWSIPLMGRSLHHLTWNFGRGNTPQGIYRVEGTIPQPDTEFFRAYGLFPLVNLFVPWESGVNQFLAGRKGYGFSSLTDYQSLLPPQWRSYYPIQQSYWAGKGGRGLFRIHGSGEPATFFTNNQMENTSRLWNPAIGCLSALELYDESGRLQRADMPTLLQKLSSVGGNQFTGYLIVVDIPGDDTSPVSLSDLMGSLKTNPHSPMAKSPKILTSGSNQIDQRS